jgi:hypothetical protein
MALRHGTTTVARGSGGLRPDGTVTGAVVASGGAVAAGGGHRSEQDDGVGEKAA